MMGKLFDQFFISAFHGEINVDELYDLETSCIVREINPLRVFENVCLLTNNNKKLISRKTRKGEIVIYRQLSHFFAKELCNSRIYSLSEIGKQICNKDHATVIHSVKKINNLIDTDRDFRDMVFELRRKLKMTL
jgi:chromosomal replication initiation ATPase DnaA